MEKLEREWIEIEHPDGSGGTGMIPADDFDPAVHRKVGAPRAAAAPAAAPEPEPEAEGDDESTGGRRRRKGGA